MTLDELLARENIQDTMVRYNVHGDRGRLDALAETFVEGGLLEYPGGCHVCRAAIAGGLADSGQARDPALRTVRHQLSTLLIDVDVDTASARTYFAVITNAGPDHNGVYVDRLRCEDGRWLFTHRQVRIDWRSPTSLFGGEQAGQNKA